MKEAANMVRQLRETAHVVDHGALRLRPAMCRRLVGHGLLEVGMQALVGVQLRTVGGQVEDLDLRRVLDQSRLHGARGMDALVVQDQEHLACRFPDQAFKEADQHRRFQCPVQHYPAQATLVGHS